jgi:hypothetical protein
MNRPDIYKEQLSWQINSLAEISLGRALWPAWE